MSNLVKHAKKELKLAGLLDKDSDYNGMLGEAVLELVKVFSKQGHSGFSASGTLDVFNKVASYKPLTPIGTTKNEWMNVSDSSGVHGCDGCCTGTKLPTTLPDNSVHEPKSPNPSPSKGLAELGTAKSLRDALYNLPVTTTDSTSLPVTVKGHLNPDSIDQILALFKASIAQLKVPEKVGQTRDGSYPEETGDYYNNRGYNQAVDNFRAAIKKWTEEL